MHAKKRWLFAGAAATTVVVGAALASTIGQPTGGDTTVELDASYDAPASANIDEAALAGSSGLIRMANVSPALGGWIRSTTSAYGGNQSWIELSKDISDNNLDDGDDEWAWTSTDSCFDADLAEGYSSSFGTADLFQPGLIAAGATDYRIGPHTGAFFLSALASGEDIVPPAGGERPVSLRFLTSPAAHGSSSSDYTITWGFGSCPCPPSFTCNSGTLTCEVVDTVTILDDTVAGSARQSATPRCQVRNRGIVATGTGADCASGYLDEVICANPDDTRDLDTLEISYSADLDGPVAVSLALDKAAYDAMFEYAGGYVTSSGALDGGDPRTIWWGLDWTQIVADGGAYGAGGDPAPLGSVEIEVFCGNSQTPGGTFSSNGGTGTAIWDTGGGAFCLGQEASYVVTLESWLDDSPAVTGLLLYYDVDHDGDGVGAEGARPDGTFATQPDCDDDDPARSPDNSEIPGNDVDEDCDGYIDCYNDFDHDGFGSTLLTAADLHGGTCDAPNDPSPRSSLGTDCLDVDTIDGQSTYPGAAPLDDAVACMKDVDGDDYGDASTTGAWDAGTDCQDEGAHAAFRNPGHAEECDGIDNDCVAGVPATEIDNDGDEYVECLVTSWRALPALACGPGQPDACGGDCVDSGSEDGVSAAAISPGEKEGTAEGGSAVTVGNDADEDCDSMLTCYQDLDEDGLGSVIEVETSFLTRTETCDNSAANVADNDLDDDDVGAIFADGFESGDTTAWSRAVP